MKRKILAVAFVTCLLGVGVAVPALANAGTVDCGAGVNGSWSNSVSANRAWSNDYSNACGTVAVKHQYNYCTGSPGIPCWSAVAYEDAYHVAKSTPRSYIVQSWHRFYIYGNQSEFYEPI
jgi:hypothetical protein